MKLLEQLDGAKIIKANKQARLIAVWHGGHGIHFYNPQGKEVEFINTGDFAEREATREEILEAIEEVFDQKVKHDEYLA